MKAIDLIRWSLRLSAGKVEGQLADIGDDAAAALTPPSAASGNHPLWLLGHAAFVEAAICASISGRPHRLERWAPLFATGTKPSADASAYPSFEEVRKAFRDGHAATLTLLDEVGEAGLDAAPKFIPPGFEEPMKTVGRAFGLIALHLMLHSGQISDCRRAAGRKPLM